MITYDTLQAVAKLTKQLTDMESVVKTESGEFHLPSRIELMIDDEPSGYTLVNYDPEGWSLEETSDLIESESEPEPADESARIWKLEYWDVRALAWVPSAAYSDLYTRSQAEQMVKDEDYVRSYRVVQATE